MAHDVFISHSAKDKATADAVCAMLESEGIRCWIAPRDVLPSLGWGEAIIDAIEQCRIMVLVFTSNANDSPQIRREVERAVNHGVAILPLRVENVLPGRSLEYFISDVHWLDALTPPLEAHLKNLAGTIKVLLARTEPGALSATQRETEAKSSESAVPREKAPAPRGFWNARSWTWAAGTVSALLLCAVFVGVHSTSRPAPAGAPVPVAPPPQSNPGTAAPGGVAPATPGPAKTAHPPQASAEKSASLPDGWYGFENGTSPQDQENNLQARCGSFHRIQVAGNASSFAALCASIGKTCFRVCDWQGASQDCNQSAPVSPNSGILVYKRDGSRIAYCTSGFTQGH